jgi:hypothetical protein
MRQCQMMKGSAKCLDTYPRQYRRIRRQTHRQSPRCRRCLFDPKLKAMGRECHNKIRTGISSRVSISSSVVGILKDKVQW